MSTGANLASLGSTLAGDELARALHRSVIYAMDPYSTCRLQQRPPKADPVAKFHAMQRVWKNDKFLSQSDRRQLMWDTRVRLAQSTML